MVKVKFKVTTFDDCSAIIPKHFGEYCKKYTNNSTVHAVSGSLGIMVFHTKEHAVDFVSVLGTLSDYKVKRVLPIGKGKTPKFIRDINFATVPSDLTKIYPTKFLVTSIPPAGTICYPAVKVIGDVQMSTL